MPLRSVFAAAFAIILSVSLHNYAAAETGRGSINGRVVDSAGAVLVGARVDVAPSGASAVTNGQGEFNISDLPAGDYTLHVRYVGFALLSQKVTVTAGQIAQMVATLKVASQNEEVVVTAEQAHGEAEAINRERTSDDIINVIPSDVITSLPNANIADAVGRLPGVTLERDEGEGKYVQIRGTEPRLNNVTIDGITIPSPEADVRQIKLDTVPAGIVDSIEVDKTLSASQDADAIGGTVNLVSKTAGESPTLSLEGIGGFTPILNTRYVGLLTATVGQRFGASKRLGVLFSGSYDYNGRGIDDIEPSPNDSATPYYGSMDLREYRYKRTRYGFGGSVDYKLKEPTSGLFLHYFYSDFMDYGDKWVYTLNDGGSPHFSTSNRLPDFGIGLLSVGGKHNFSTSWLAWDLSAARSRQKAAAGDPGVDFQYNGSTICNYDQAATTDVHFPQFNPACDAASSPIFNPNLWTLQDVNTTSGITSQVDLQGAVSYGRRYHVGSHPSTLEVGVKERNGHKGQDAISPTYDQSSLGSNPPLGPTMTEYLTGFTNPNYYFGKYNFGRVTNFEKITNDINNLISQGVLAYDAEQTQFTSASGNFDLTERVSAAYAMNTIDFGRFRLQTGLRFEATQLNILGYVVNQTQNAAGNLSAVTIPKPASTWYWDPLPSAQLRYQLTDESNVRISYGRGISRPDPYDLVPYVTVDQTTNPYTISIGNPNLKPEHSNNFDLLFEHYLKPFGEIQAGLFYKQLSAPIYYIADPHSQNPLYPQYAGDNFAYIINGVNARLNGFEAAYIQHLGFLPGALSGFGILSNFTWTASNAGALPLRSDRPALQRQAPLSWNLSPTYDRGRFSAQLGASYNGAMIYQYQWTQCTASESAGAGCEDPAGLGPKGPAGDNYLYAHLQVDAQASFHVQRSLTLIAQGLNLTNEVFGFYNGSPWYLTQREFYKPTYSFGLRWEPHRAE